MRSPSELPLLRILHIKTLSAALSMLHSINYGTLSSCGSNGMGYCILEEKMATTTNSWMGPGTCLEETPWHIALSRRDRVAKWLRDRRGGGTSPGSAKQRRRAVHPSHAPRAPPAHGRWWRNQKGEWGTGAAGAGDAVSDRASSSSPPSPSLPAERDARLTPPPGRERHHKVLIRETWQADEETAANITAPLPHGARGCREGGDRPRGIMLAKPRRGQRQAKVGGRGASSRTRMDTHTTRPMRDTGDTTSI